MMQDLLSYSVWQNMQTISLDEMQTVKLMNRIDTKFIADISILFPLLERASYYGYRVQTINNSPVNNYNTIYYDTYLCDMYLRHHNKQLERQKIRSRMYSESKMAFLEIKNKNNKGRTKKRRIELPLDQLQCFSDNKEAVVFVNSRSNYSMCDLMPQLKTSFDRITLVNKEKTERLTIDVNLKFDNIQNKKHVDLPGLLIIELKQDSLCRSQMKGILIDLRVKPIKISKYCIGTVLTNPNVKNNRFKIKIVMINKIVHK